MTDCSEIEKLAISTKTGYIVNGDNVPKFVGFAVSTHDGRLVQYPLYRAPKFKYDLIIFSPDESWLYIASAQCALHAGFDEHIKLARDNKRIFLIVLAETGQIVKEGGSGWTRLHKEV